MDGTAVAATFCYTFQAVPWWLNALVPLNPARKHNTPAIGGLQVGVWGKKYSSFHVLSARLVYVEFGSVQLVGLYHRAANYMR